LRGGLKERQEPFIKRDISGKEGAEGKMDGRSLSRTEKYLARRLRKAGRFLSGGVSWLTAREEKKLIKKIALLIGAVFIGSFLIARFLSHHLPAYTWPVISLAAGLAGQYIIFRNLTLNEEKRIVTGGCVLAAIAVLAFSPAVLTPYGTTGGLSFFCLLLIVLAGVLLELKMNVLDVLFYLFVAQACSLRAQRLAGAGRFEEAFRVIMGFQYDKADKELIRFLCRKNPLQGNSLSQYLIDGAEAVDRAQVAAALQEQSAVLLSRVQELEKQKQDPRRAVDWIGYDGYVGIASAADIERCDIGKKKREYLDDWAVIAGQQAALGFFREAEQTLRQMYSLADSLTTGDYAEAADLPGGSGWVSTWLRPEEVARDSRQAAKAKADKTADHLAALGKMAQAAGWTPADGNIVQYYVHFCLQKGKPAQSIRYKEKLGLHFRDVMKVLSRAIEQTWPASGSLRNRAVRQAIRYAFLKREEHTYRRNRPDDKMVKTALYLVSLGVENKEVLEI
jgi:hypothetical protein